MITSLANRLELARRQRFVGRKSEQQLFQSSLAAADWSFLVLHIFGPGGVGKTTLLREFASLATQSGVQVVYLDGRNLEAEPSSFLSALQQALNLAHTSAIISHFSTQTTRHILFVDTAELLSPLDGWLRDTFLPQLPGNVLVTIAGRNPPSLAWRTDPGWQSIMRVLPLRNLDYEEVQNYLNNRQVPPEEHEVVWGFTHGHALALSLVADLFAQRPGFHFQPEDAPDVIQLLLEKLVQKVPGPAHRAALEASALIRLTTESILAEMLQATDVHEIFEWLRDLSFMESERRGIFPHDLAREALVADLRWRNPDWFAELQHRAHQYYLERVKQNDLTEQQRTLSNYIFLHRDNPLIQPYFEWQESGTVYTDSFRSADLRPLLQLVAEFEGESSRGLAAGWLAHPQAKINIIRHATGQPHGFLLSLPLERLTEAEIAQDVATLAAWAYLQQHSPLRPGETATLFRFWMSQEVYQGVSPVQSRIFLNIIQHYLSSPGLAYTFLPCANPDFWAASFAYTGLQRVPEADFEVDGQGYGVYGHDWRVVPPLRWLEKVTEQRVSDRGSAVETAVSALLSQTQFEWAVREALRHFVEPALLQSNPLLQSRLVTSYVKSAEVSPVAALQALLRKTAVSFQNATRQSKFYWALHYTYFDPMSTQEQVAERLDLPFSTYRRHLRSGIELMTQLLWQQETN